jgi:hypothetical protein
MGFSFFCRWLDSEPHNPNTKFFCKCWGTDPHQMLADVLTPYEMRESINTRDLFDTGTVFPVSNLSVVEIPAFNC